MKILHLTKQLYLYLICILSIGIELTDVEAEPGRPVELMEGKSENSVTFRLTATPSLQSGGIQGFDLWNLNVFGSLNPFGAGERINQVSEVLAPNQRSTGLFPPSIMNFGHVQHYFNMTGVECGDIMYLCAELVQGAEPNPEFQLNAIPDERVLIDCFNVHCLGIVIRETKLDLYNGGGLLDRDVDTNHLSFGVQILAGMESGDAVGDMLWRMEAYISNDYAGYGTRHVLKRQLLNIEQSGYDIHSGERLEFNNLATMLERDQLSCEEQLYLCVELMRGNDKIKFMGSRPGSLRDCEELNCAERPKPVVG